MPVNFTNIFWNKILIPLRSDLRTEFGSSCKVYISDEYESNGNLSIRLFTDTSTFEEDRGSAELREYQVEIAYYLISTNTNKEKLFEKLYRDASRIEALLFSKRFKNTSSTQGFFNGIVSDIVVNSKTDDELNIDNLNTVKFSFTCQYEGNYS